MQPALSQVCSLPSPWDKDVEEYAAGACRTIELWLGKLEGWLERHSVSEARDLLAAHQVAAPVASFQGGLLISQGQARAEHWSHFARRLELCRQLAVETLVVAGDLVGPLIEQDVARAKVSLAAAARDAQAAGVGLALEFQAHATLGNNLQTAAGLVEEIGHGNLGLCLDLFHFHTGPSKEQDLELLSPENLFHVQVCDLAGTPRKLATDSDRVLPGDGDVALAPVIDRLRAIGYAGCVSVELMNPQLWAVPPRQFGEIAMTALRRCLGQASMG